MQLDLASIDVEFDARSDTPVGKDPDSFSPTLREMHRLLWSKPLPGGEVFTLTALRSGPYLLHESTVGRFALSSDTIVGSHRKALPALYSQMTDVENAHFHSSGYRVAGTIVFPGLQVDGLPTMNQSRGVHSRVKDRFDLTLECIRLHYHSEPSPLAETLARYRDFFALFGSFSGYVEFFLLDDLVAVDGSVMFFHPFGGFAEPALPVTLDDYRRYRDLQLAFVMARSDRVAQFASGVH